MEINITRFVTDCDAYDFSGSVAERGEHADRDTWNNAKRESVDSPLLTTPEQLNALREYVKGFGAWDRDEIASWNDVECNALFIQLISGDIREMGLNDTFLDEFDWNEYESNDQLQHNIYHCDDGQIYYYLGN